MRGTALFATLILLTIPLAGCMEDTGDMGDTPGGTDTVQINWVDRPDDMQTGEAVSMTWNLTGPSQEIPHTGAHYADHSVEDPQSPADYGNTTGAVEPAQVPDEFDADETFDEPGTYYFRAHAIVDGENLWTPEIAINVSEGGPIQAPVQVSIDSAPSEGRTGQNLTVNWSVTGAPDEIQHTGFHWADFNVSDPKSPTDYGNSTGVQEPAQVPGSFNGTFSEAEPGTYYGRAHAIYDGKHYWSDEIEIEISSNGTVAKRNVTVEIRDEGPQGLLGASFVPQNATVLQGGQVTWENVGEASHSIDFANESLEDSPTIDPGENWTWNVSADLEPGEYEYTDGEAASDASGSIQVKAKA